MEMNNINTSVEVESLLRHFRALDAFVNELHFLSTEGVDLTAEEIFELKEGMGEIMAQDKLPKALRMGFAAGYTGASFDEARLVHYALLTHQSPKIADLYLQGLRFSDEHTGNNMAHRVADYNSSHERTQNPLSEEI